MDKRLYVGSLSYSIDDDKLKEIFAQYGEVKDSKVIKDRDTGHSKGFGFVEMSTPEEAQKAIQELNNTSHMGRTITVSEAKPREPRDGSGGRRQGGGGFR